MKMGEIPSLYELACRAYSGTWILGYQEAFDKAMSEEEKPSLIIIRIASEVQEIPYNNDVIKNPFMWRIAYMNEELFGLNGPLQSQHGTVSQVAVIEDYWEDGWGDPYDTPELDVCQFNTLYGWNKDPYEETNLPSEEQEVRLARCLYPEEIVREFRWLCNPDDVCRPIEGQWFEDAKLPLHVVDGVPESKEHSERRNRGRYDGNYF